MRRERLKGAGRFIDPIVVEENTGETTDKNGKKVPNWTQFADPFALVEYLSGDEAIVERQRRPTATHRVRMYELPGFNEKMRINFNQRILHVEEISDPNAGEISVLCHEAK